MNTNIKRTVKRSRLQWSECEDMKLLDLYDKGYSYREIGICFGDRSAEQVRNRHRTLLCQQQNTQISFNMEDDWKLLKAVSVDGPKWEMISGKFFDKKISATHLKNRWRRLSPLVLSATSQEDLRIRLIAIHHIRSRGTLVSPELCVKMDCIFMNGNKVENDDVNMYDSTVKQKGDAPCIYTPPLSALSQNPPSTVATECCFQDSCKMTGIGKCSTACTSSHFITREFPEMKTALEKQPQNIFDCFNSSTISDRHHTQQNPYYTLHSSEPSRIASKTDYCSITAAENELLSPLKDAWIEAQRSTTNEISDVCSQNLEKKSILSFRSACSNNGSFFCNMALGTNGSGVWNSAVDVLSPIPCIRLGHITRNIIPLIITLITSANNLHDYYVLESRTQLRVFLNTFWVKVHSTYGKFTESRNQMLS